MYRPLQWLSLLPRMSPPTMHAFLPCTPPPATHDPLATHAPPAMHAMSCNACPPPNPSHACPRPPPPCTNRHLWKHNLRRLRFRAVKKLTKSETERLIGSVTRIWESRVYCLHQLALSKSLICETDNKNRVDMVTGSVDMTTDCLLLL